jgi:dTMP kinase
MPGKLIIVEGPNHSGKTTLIQKLQKALEERGHKVRATREPGGSPYGEALRSILKTTAGLHSFATALGMNSARVQHAKEVIKPGIANGEIILCDRYTPSTEAYQIFMGQMTPVEAKLIHHIHKTLPNPNIILFLQPSLGTLKNRASHADAPKEGRTENDVFEGNIKKERNAYESVISLAKQAGQNILIIRDDYNQHLQTITDRILAA